MTGPEKTQETKRICLGKITSPHGVKGLVKILPYGEDISLLETLSPLFTGEKSEERVSVTLKSSAGKFMLAEIENCNDRDKADQFRNTELWCLRSDLPEIENEGEFYIEDLINIDAKSPEGNELGKIIAVQNFGSADLLEIKPPVGQSYFIPFKDEYVGDINLDENYVIIINAETMMMD